MKRKALEALSESVAAYSGYFEAGSPLYDARNPGGLRTYSHPTTDHLAKKYSHTSGVDGLRVFRSVIDGWQALFYDVELKVTGKSRAQLKPESTLIDLSASYNLPVATATAWARFLRKALHDDSVKSNTILSHFTKE